MEGEAVEHAEHENSEFDSRMQDMLQVIDRILSGDENDFDDLNLSENRAIRCYLYIEGGGPSHIDKQQQGREGRERTKTRGLVA